MNTKQTLVATLAAGLFAGATAVPTVASTGGAQHQEVAGDDDKDKDKSSCKGKGGCGSKVAGDTRVS